MSSSSSSSSSLNSNLPPNWGNIHPLTLSLYLSNKDFFDNTDDLNDVKINFVDKKIHIRINNIPLNIDNNTKEGIKFTTLRNKIKKYGIEEERIDEYFDTYRDVLSGEVDYRIKHKNITKEYISEALNTYGIFNTTPESIKIYSGTLNELDVPINENSFQTSIDEPIIDIEEAADPHNINVQEIIDNVGETLIEQLAEENILQDADHRDNLEMDQISNAINKTDQLQEESRFEFASNNQEIYTNPIFPLSIQIFNVKVDNKMDLKNYSKEMMLFHSKRLVDNYGVELFIDKLVYGNDNDINLIGKQFNELVQIYKKYLCPCDDKNSGLSVDDIIEIRDSLAQDNVFVKPRNILESINPDLLNERRNVIKKEMEAKKMIENKDRLSKLDKKYLLRVTGTSLVNDDINGTSSNSDASNYGVAPRFIEDYDRNYVDPIEIKLLRQGTEPYIYTKHKIGPGSTLNDVVNIDNVKSIERSVIIGSFGNEKDIKEDINDGKIYDDTDNNINVTIRMVDEF